MRVVHLTDLHVQTTPGFADLLGKRLIGSANLYLMGRRSHFSVEAQRAAVQATVDANPDVVVITGDLTAQALEAEFAAAHALLLPVLERFPTVMIPGNHDTYVSEAEPGARMRQHFGAWMGERSPDLHVFDEVGFLTVETCRTHLLSSGRVPPAQADAARALLADSAAGFTFLCIHYPLVNRHGAPYGPATRAISNPQPLMQLLAETDRIHAVLHGHEHHGFRASIQTAGGPIPVLDPGASGYALLKDQDRTAHLNIYEVDGKGLHSVSRLRFDGVHFAPEPGGAYATGR